MNLFRQERISRIREEFKNNSIDAIILSSSHNKYYLANLFSSSGYIVITRKKQYIIVDFRYYEEMKNNNELYTIIMMTKQKSFFTIINSIIKEEEIKSIGFEGSEVSYDFYKELEKKLSVDLKAIDLSKLRKFKDEEEVKDIQKACEIGDKAFEHIIKFIKPGISEKEVENEIVRFIKSQGGEKESFDIIVASGYRGALPHGRASDKVIKNGEMVTMDFGVKYNKYSSDITRTIAVGECPKELVSVYEIVKKAGDEALKAVKAGITAGKLDSVARKVIEIAGYGEFFGHNLGHGLGILVHEYPSIAPNSNEVLLEGMIITIEPGIYIPNLGGVRIEEDVLITKDCGIRLTKSSRELITI